MANPPNIIREMVSGQRIRYTEDGFNLDLSYIKVNIIAMGYPADSMEAFYRNKREDVHKFLTEKHGNKYKVYNLCSERNYVQTLFPHYAEYPFKDHNPPDIELINKFCEDVHNFLRADSSHVVAIHCKAGKGRTGTMICCYLLYSGAFQTANEALTYYAEKRTKDKKGVTIPSQRRYVAYYEQLLRNRLTYKDVALYVEELRISPADVPLKSGSIKMKGVKDSLPLLDFQRTDEYVTITIDRCMALTGDVEVVFIQASKLQEKRWHFWFNTFFVERAANYDSHGRLVLTLDQKEIDDAHKGNFRKCPEKVQVFLKSIPPNGKYSENLDADRRSHPLSQPLVDGSQTYATANNHHSLQYQQQAQQRHHLALIEPLSHNQTMLPNTNFSDPQLHQQQQQHHRGPNNNRASLGNSQQNSGIYCNISPEVVNQMQQQQHGAAAASSPLSKQSYKKNAVQPKPTQQQQHHHQPAHQQQQQQLLNHSGGSSEEISGTDSVEEEDDEQETEGGWDSGHPSSKISSIFSTLKKQFKKITTHIRPLHQHVPLVQPDMFASTSMASGLHADGTPSVSLKQGVQRRSLPGSFIGVASTSSSTSFGLPSSSVTSTSSRSPFGDLGMIAQTSSSEEEVLLPKPGAETGEDTDDSALLTRPPSHDQDRFVVPGPGLDDHLMAGMRRSSDRDVEFVFFKRGSSGGLPPCPLPDSGRGSTEIGKPAGDRGHETD